MLYDFHGSWENTVNVHSSMYSDDGLNVVSYTFPPWHAYFRLFSSNQIQEMEHYQHGLSQV